MSDEWWTMNDDLDAITPGQNKSSSPSSEVKVCGENLANSTFNQVPVQQSFTTSAKKAEYQFNTR